MTLTWTKIISYATALLLLGVMAGIELGKYPVGGGIQVLSGVIVLSIILSLGQLFYKGY